MTTAPNPQLIPSQKDWTGQFAIGGADMPTRPGTTTHVLNGIILQIFSGLKVTSVADQGGTNIGWLLGDPIDYSSHAFISDQLTITLDKDVELDDAIEQSIYRFSGPFIFVLATTHAKRIYLDACGSLSLVYSVLDKMAASSTGLILDDDAYSRRFEKTLYDFLDVRGEGWFPAGLTAHAGIERLMCNHYLDLINWRSVRHWPSENLPNTPDPDRHIARIGAIAHDTISVLLDKDLTAMALTAGNETRLLLACCKDIVDKLDFVTVDAPAIRLDVVRASDLSKRFHLRHFLLPLVTASREQALQFEYQAGHCRGGGNVQGHPSIEPLAKYRFFVGGLGGEIGRAFFWRSSDDDTTKISADSIGYRLGMPIHPKVIEAIEVWLKGVENLNPLLQIDLAYLELRMSCWGFAQAYSHPVVPHIHPLISRESFRLMLELPPDWKRKRLLIIRGIEQQWPELLSLPINRYGDKRDLLLKITKAMKNPYLIIKKMRKRFGGIN